jgi:hypothetical protein
MSKKYNLIHYSVKSQSVYQLLIHELLHSCCGPLDVEKNAKNMYCTQIRE